MIQIKKPVTLTFTPDEYDSLRSAARLQLQEVIRLSREASARTIPDQKEIAFYDERRSYWEAFVAKMDAPHDAFALADKTQDGGWNHDDSEDDAA